MNYILFDDTLVHGALLPLTYTRPISHIRLGIVTIAEKWLHFLQGEVSYLTEGFLQKKYISVWGEDNLLINGSLCPDQNLITVIKKLSPGESLQCGNVLVALRTPHPLKDCRDVITQAEKTTVHTYTGTLTQVRQLSDIFLLNGSQIRSDYAWITEKRISKEITDPHTIMYNPSQIFLEEGAKTKACILNAENGPIYIGKYADIQEGSIIRGPFAIGESSIVALGAKMRGEITIGPHCKIGGEVSNSILFGFSNKGHDGYLGNSILGEWCNLGADTNTSNLKNDYGLVKQWSYAEKDFVDTGRQFVGLVMGDHSKAGINTMFNTGTVVGVSANIFGGNFPPKHIPSFTWGGADGLDTYRLDRALEVAQRVLERKAILLTAEDREILTYVFHATHGIQ
ncbi:GlmU family protein [Xanthocytophaga agilis]|uniref:GlmU family protein n=1 Tax=Xanthocytophaga agilis TaxID=3048010 RepID=A0AAE3RD89_9BACT|nr:GlmU family protein [Xanthocytophaga agilis]MDJ1506487.1 GlmU family protein [Xanthocytophaga agilis]